MNDYAELIIFDDLHPPVEHDMTFESRAAFWKQQAHELATRVQALERELKLHALCESLREWR